MHKNKAAQIGIYSETDPLRSVALFGLPSIEVLMSQFYPEEISLTLGVMDIIKARKETKQFIKALEDNNVNVHTVKDYLVKSSPETKKTKAQILKSLTAKIKNLQTSYNQEVKNWQDTLTFLMDEEIKQYGQEKALAFIENICLIPDYPLANIIYARDSMNVLLQTRVISNMKKPIRQPEIKFYEKFYQQGLGLTNYLKIKAGETFEGGDAYTFNNTIFIGISSRTSINAAISIFQNIASYSKDYEFALVIDDNWDQRSYNDQQDNMHLDTFSMPFSKDKIVVCEEEGLRREVSLVKINGDEIKIIQTNKNYIQFLEQKGHQVFVIPRKEQQSFGCNFLVLNQDKILIPRGDNLYTNKLLEQAGKQLIKVDLSECTKGYGAAHCMTGQLLRAA